MKIIFDHSRGQATDDKILCEAFAIPEGESYDCLLENGWLPAIEPPIYWYQAQSIRINCDRVELSKKQVKTFSIVERTYFDYANQKEVDDYFSDFFDSKNLDMKDFYQKNSGAFNLKVMCLRINDSIVGFTRFLLLENCILGFESSYQTDLPKHSLGINSILFLSEYGKSFGMKYVYIYEAYKDLFAHKFLITGSEYWEGEKWLPTSAQNFSI